MSQAKVIRVIQTYEHRGQGTKDDPSRIVFQLWTLDGRLLAEWDPTSESGYSTCDVAQAESP